MPIFQYTRLNSVLTLKFNNKDYIIDSFESVSITSSREKTTESPSNRSASIIVEKGGATPDSIEITSSYIDEDTAKILVTAFDNNIMLGCTIRNKANSKVNMIIENCSVKTKVLQTEIDDTTVEKIKIMLDGHITEVNYGK